MGSSHMSESQNGIFSIEFTPDEVVGFLPTRWQLNRKSPSRKNFCHSSIKMILEDYTYELSSDASQAEHIHVQEEASDEEGSLSLMDVCTPLRRGPEFYKSLDKARISSEIRQKMSRTCGDAPAGIEDRAKQIYKIHADHSKLRKTFEQRDVPAAGQNDWETTSKFDKSWLKFINDYQKNIMPLRTLVRPDIQRWFQYLPNQDEPEKSRFRCRICYENLKRFNVKPRKKSDIYTKEGYLARTRDTNRKTIEEHVGSNYHQQVIQDLIEEASGQLTPEFKRAQKRKSSPPHKETTINIIRSVFVATKLNMPFSNFPALVSLQEANGAKMGEALHGREDCKQIMTFISEKMSTIWKGEMMKTDRPFTMIVDGSHDASAYHYMVVMLHTIEENRPKSTFYRLLKMGKKEDAEAFYEVITKVESKC